MIGLGPKRDFAPYLLAHRLRIRACDDGSQGANWGRERRRGHRAHCLLNLP